MGCAAPAQEARWPLSPAGFEGNPYGFPTAREFTYPNAQRSTLLWYHDHAMDRVGRHVHAGLVGLYFIRDGVVIIPKSGSIPDNTVI